jgi:hypothetical protein
MTKDPLIPDDQANKVREALSKKSIKPEDSVQDELEDMARDIALIEPNPVGWNGWAICLDEPTVDAVVLMCVESKTI